MKLEDLNPNRDLIELLRAQRCVLSEIREALGWDRETAKAEVRRHQGERLIERHGREYYLSDFFHELDDGEFVPKGDLLAFLSRGRRDILQIRRQFNWSVGEAKRVVRQHVDHGLIESIGRGFRAAGPALSAVPQSHSSLLEVLADGRWRDKLEIDEALGGAFKMFRPQFQALVETGEIQKAGREYRWTKAKGNHPGPQLKALYEVLNEPRLQRHMGWHYYEEFSTTIRHLKRLEEQGLVVRKDLRARHSDGKLASRITRVWCNDQAVGKLKAILREIGADKKGVFDEKKLQALPALQARKSFTLD